MNPLPTSGRAGRLGLGSNIEKSGSVKETLIGSRYISGTFWTVPSSSAFITCSNLNTYRRLSIFLGQYYQTFW